MPAAGPGGLEALLVKPATPGRHPLMLIQPWFAARCRGSLAIDAAAMAAGVERLCPPRLDGRCR